MVVFEPTAGHVAEMVDHVAENPGLQLQLIEYMPELAGHPEWAIDIDRVHDWLEDRADEVEHREMHDRKRYGCTAARRRSKVIVPPPRWPRPTAGYEPAGQLPRQRDGRNRRPRREPRVLRQLPSRARDARRLPEGLSQPQRRPTPDGHDPRGIRETFEAVVENRVPYYGEYLVRDGDDGWTINEEYIGA